MGLIFKIVGAEEWRAAETVGAFHGAAVDLVDGFIHFSTADQVAETAEKWFRGREDLVLVAVDDAALGEALRYEPSRGGALFPHLYASLPTASALWCRPLPLGSDGAHVLGSLSK